MGTLRILDAIRTCGLEKDVRFYQASTSELYGKVQEIPQSETTPFYPRSPYGLLLSLWSRQPLILSSPSCCKAVRLLDHHQLSRSIQHVRREWNTF